MATKLKLSASPAHSKLRKKNTAPSVKEHESQVALFEWAKWAVKKYPDLEYLFSIPNGFILSGEKRYAVVNYMKGEGLKNGVPDLCLPCPRGNYAGMFIEMKTANGVLSDAQKGWIEYLSVAYKVVVARSAQQAIDEIVSYLD